MAEEQLDYGDEEFTGSQKMQYHGDGAIPALADDEIGGEDDEYDDLYNDVNVGEGFLQMQRSESLPSTNIGNGSFHDQKVNNNVQEPRSEAMIPQDTNTNININTNTPNVAGEPPYPKEGVMSVDLLQKRMVPLPQKPPVDPVNEPPPMLNSNPGQQIPNMTPATRPMMTENQTQPRQPGEGGATTLFVGELHWWTTDAELENVLSQYGRVKEIKFFDERASGKSKGYCQVEFYEAGPAAACKEGMNGYLFNGRPCVVAFASPQTIRQMGASYANKNNQNPVQSQEPGRRPMNDSGGRGGGGGGGANFSGGDSGRGFGRGGNWGGRGGQGVGRGGVGGMRGRGGMGGPKNMNAGGPGFGYGGPGFAGPPGGFMHPMGGGFDPTYMGRGGGYGGFPGGGFPGMMPNFPGVNAMGIAGVAPHVNPAFFGRGMGGMMGGGGGMEGPQGGMWGDTGGMGQWGGGGEESHGQRTRESSYGGEDGGSEYGYTDTEKGSGAQRSNTGREKEREREREWSGNSEKRHREEREYEKDYKYKEEKDNYREHSHSHRHKERGHEEEWDRGQSSTRSRSRSRAVPEEDHHRSRSRDADYGKRRRSMRSD